MSTELIEAPAMGVVKFNVTDSEIAKMKDEYMSLTINGIDDKLGFKKVYESRQIVKKTRTSLVKAANEMKEQAIAWQRKVNGEKDRIVGELEAIEGHLQGEEDKIEAEKAKIQKEKDDAEAARIQARIDKLAAFGFAIDYVTITAIDEPTFEKVLANAKAEHEKELAAKAEADRLAKEEESRLKAEREELEKLRKERDEAQRIINENNERIAKEQREREANLVREQQRLLQEKFDQEQKIKA